MTAPVKPVKAKQETTPPQNDDLLARLKSRKTRERVHPVVLDDALRVARDQAVQRLQFAAFTLEAVQQRIERAKDAEQPAADSGLDGELAQAKRAVEDRAGEAEAAQQALDEQTVQLRIRALPSRGDDSGSVNWTDLIAAHGPPRDSDLLFHPITFPPALIAASIVDGPGADNIADLLAAWDIGTVEDLFAACWDLNTAAPPGAAR